MKAILTIVALTLVTLLAQPALAAEGANQYPHGVNTWGAGAAPPPGLYYINMFGYVGGNLKNGSGDTVRLADGSKPSVGVWFEAARVSYVSNKKILGGNWGALLIVPFVRQTTDIGGSETVAGIGDITIDPFSLAWHKGNFHAVAGMDIYMPSGKFDLRDARKSISSNYMSYTPLVGMSWMPPSGWEVSTLMMFNMPGKNLTTDYKTGKTFHADYLVGKHFGNWGVGLSGYVVKQVTDDVQNGRTVAANPGMWDEGRRGQAIAAGPSVSYNAGKCILSFQWNHEMAVRNRFGGDKFVFKAIIPIGAR